MQTRTVDELKNIVIDSDVVFGEAAEYLAIPPDSFEIKRWPIFSKFINGLRMKEFSIFCGPTGTGKTSFLANLSAELLSQNVKHFVASVETGRVDFIIRVCEVLANREINTGKAMSTVELKEFISDFSGFFKNQKMLLSNAENRVNVHELCEQLEYASACGAKVALLDNLNFFLEVSSAANSVIEMDKTIHELIMLVKRLPIHVILIVHPRKTEHGRVESEFDIKGSSTAVQEAQNVLLFNRLRTEDNPDGKRNNWREIMFAKVRRNGKASGGRVYFNGDKPEYVEDYL